MESDKIAIAALLFILLIVGSNVAMYFIARGSINKGESNWMKAFRNTLNKPSESESEKSMNELRKRIQDLENKKTGK